MPELPEVETIAEELNKSCLIDVPIAFVEIHWAKTIDSPSIPDFIKRVVGQKITGLGRRAKYLQLFLSGGETLIIHLRMTGRLTIKPKGAERLSHEHVVIGFENGYQLHFHDTRKFGRWQLVANTSTVFAKLGVEPLSPAFSKDKFLESLKLCNRQLKPLLLDQRFIAGLGNIYVDEALWEAGVHPQTRASKLNSKEAEKLYHAIKAVLKKGLLAQGTTLGKGKANFYRLDGSVGKHQEILNVFRRTGKPCPRCQEPIIRLLVGQRSTHICPNCQKITHKDFYAYD